MHSMISLAGLPSVWRHKEEFGWLILAAPQCTSFQ